jgi:hypothetical protein
MFGGELSISPLNLVICGRSFDHQDLVVVSLRRHHGSAPAQFFAANANSVRIPSEISFELKPTVSRRTV